MVHASQVPDGSLLVIFTGLVSWEYAAYEFARKHRKYQVCLICANEG